MSEELITYSEIFHSLQGEGTYTGKNTAWVRLFNCNLDCHGFGQKDPTDPSTYDLPYMNFDEKSVNTLEELPVWERGCDSSYSWAVKYKHLNHRGSAQDICNKIINCLKSESNPRGTFTHEKSKQETHLCFTGGEPLLPKNQRAIIAILEQFKAIRGGPIRETPFFKPSNIPEYITVETNGTQMLTDISVEYFKNRGLFNSELFFSISPKLFTVSGETNQKAIKPEVVKQYQWISNRGQLKFVVGDNDRQWDELERVVNLFRDSGIIYDVYIMPTGATEEQQYNVASKVSDRALKLGYHVSARVHTYIYGNRIGT